MCLINKNGHRINISCLSNDIICKKLFAREKSVFCIKKWLILVYLLVLLEKKRKPNLIYQKTTEQVRDYLRNEDPNFKNSIIGIVGNNRSDLRKCLLATSDYGKNIQEKN